ncbi:ionotropic receptor 75a-like [Phymastichus coffea]|uniref:ionotropic receptor 75a-like n=1 Tax=Phymastichus coffea TaxID=108790 RepID=UPI00273C8C72|nr:ionotropic receptor 75a-like [Phymastichus coffea]
MLNVFKSVITLRILFIIFLFLPVDFCDTDVNNVFITDYFLFRAPSNVIAFTCNQYDSDVHLLKKFSDVQLQTAIRKLENTSDLFTFTKMVYQKLGIFIDLRCQLPEYVKSTFDKATNYKMFDELYYWLILSSSLDQGLSLINDNSFGLSTDFVIAVFENNWFTLYDVYNPCKVRGGKLKVSKIGSWDKTNGLKMLYEMNKLRRWNLEGLKLKISGIVTNKPSNISVADYLLDNNFRLSDRMTRIAYVMWLHVADKFNFTIDFSESSNVNEKEENDPVIIALMKGEIDASGTAEIMTTQRVDLLKAVYPSIPYRTSFIFRSTSSDRLSVRDIFLPLSSTVWYLTLALSILSVNALALLSVVAKEDFYENYLRSIIINVGAFCQQGTEFSSNNLSGRIAILHILLFYLLLYNYYLASAVSNRLSEPIKFINDSLHELRNKDFEYASEPMLDFDHHMKNPDWETRSFYLTRWSKIPESQRFISPEKGMSLVLKGGFAYHTHPEISYPYIERHFDHRKICEIQEVHLIRPVQLSLFVHINSSFIEMFKSGFLRLTEVGIRFRQIQMWSSRKPLCRTDLLTADSITIKEVAPAIIFLLCSMLVASVLLTTELIFSYYHKRNKRSSLRNKIENVSQKTINDFTEKSLQSPTKLID